MNNLKEIEDRHKDATILIACNVAPHLGIAPSTLALDAHADRATLLAEVKRLKALCGRAAEQNGHSIRCIERAPPCQCDWGDILAELKEASHE